MRGKWNLAGILPKSGDKTAWDKEKVFNLGKILNDLRLTDSKSHTEVYFFQFTERVSPLKLPKSIQLFFSSVEATFPLDFESTIPAPSWVTQNTRHESNSIMIPLWASLTQFCVAWAGRVEMIHGAACTIQSANYNHSPRHVYHYNANWSSVLCWDILINWAS